MAVKETSLGEGTIAYQGESPEYWSRKSGRLPAGRLAITVGLALVGLLLVAYAGSPLAPTPVTGVVTGNVTVTADENSTADLTYLQDGTSHHANVEVDGIAHVGETVPLLVHPGGSVSQGDGSSAQSIWLIGLLLIAVAGGRALWARRHRDERLTFA